MAVSTPKGIAVLIMIVGSAMLLVGASHAQVCGFAHQGRLRSAGAPANGEYDFQFQLYEDQGGDTPIGDPILVEDLTVTDGLFRTTLDFGCVFSGGLKWLETSVREGSSTGSYTTLSPRHPVRPVPRTTYADEAGNADTVDGMHADELLDTQTYDSDGNGSVDAADTAAYAADADRIDGAHASDFVSRSGDTMTGPLTLSGAPGTELQAATKGYVDGRVNERACLVPGEVTVDLRPAPATITDLSAQPPSQRLLNCTIPPANGYDGILATTVVPMAWDQSSATATIVHSGQGYEPFPGQYVRVRFSLHSTEDVSALLVQDFTLELSDTPTVSVVNLQGTTPLGPGDRYFYKLTRICDHTEDSFPSGWDVSGLFITYSTRAVATGADCP